jgi:hypothetical protein
MTDLEISKRLALAIGWPELNIRVSTLTGKLLVLDEADGAEWRFFDYHDWNVIGPIAERYGCFPQEYQGMWTADFDCYETPQKAIAMAVIGAKK